MNHEEQPKKKRFKLFDTQREGRGVTKEEADLPPGFKKFFILYRRDFMRLLPVNAFMVFGNFPVFFLLIALSGLVSLDFVKATATEFSVFSGLLEHQLMQNQGAWDAPLLALNGILATPSQSSSFTPLAYVFLGIGCLTFFTFGLVNVGTTYLMRNMIKGDPVFVWSDFFYAVKRNFKQGFFFGMLDLLLLLLIPFNVMVLSQGSGFFNGVLFWLNLVIGFLYLLMRCFIYLQMITFDLSIRKLLKNSLIFSFIGIKRLIPAILGNLVLIGFNIFLAFTGPFLSLAAVLPILFLFANCAYMTTYAAYFKIKEVMIDPYVKENETTEGDPAET